MMFNPLFDIESLIKNEDYVSVYERLMLIRDFHVIFNKELVDEPTALQMFQCFSQENLDLNVQDRQGKTFLMYACDNDYIGIIRYLCTHNADMELKDNDGNTGIGIQSGTVNKDKSIIGCIGELGKGLWNESSTQKSLSEILELKEQGKTAKEISSEYGIDVYQNG